MKNIHIIPTEKPSRLYKDDNQVLTLNTHPVLKGIFTNGIGSNQHIYITNSEEIKEGDWYLNVEEKNSIKNPFYGKLYKANQSIGKVSLDYLVNNLKKIILTTDQDLDGVQSIDDKFLEWFIKNPSCEIVEIKPKLSYIDGKYIDSLKIIIPQEEPKTGYSKSETEFLGIEFTLKDGSKQFVPKQETLEEAAESYAKGWASNSDKEAFIDGANYQAERMYSEEEAIQLLIKFNQEIREVDDVRGWFEQFKKK
jgi:hypothetical protein